MNRQLEWQREQKKRGLCIICGRTAIPNTNHCVRCWLKKTFLRYGKVYSTSKTERELQQLVDNEHIRRTNGRAK